MKNKLGIRGEVKFFQTEKGIELPTSFKNLTKEQKDLIIPGSLTEDNNTISTNLKNYLAYKIGTDTTDRALDALTISDGLVASVGAANNGKDGMFWGVTAPSYTDVLVLGILDTSLNTGGTEAEAYIEFYGFVDGSQTVSSQLSLAHNYVDATTKVSTIFATYALSETVAASRRFHFYWKITIS